jgi:general secretion pathway protein N
MRGTRPVRSSAAVAVALILYAVCLVGTAPASVLAWALAAATANEVVLASPEGSAWRGRAEALVINVQSSGARRYERLRWGWLGAPLLSGEFAVWLQLDDPKLRGRCSVALRPSRVRVTEVEFTLPASSLASYWPTLSPAGLSGEVTLQASEFAISKGRYAGAATIEWRNAASALAGVHPLGNYRALVTGRGEHAEFRVETRHGVLRVEGQGRGSRREGLSFQGTARPDPHTQGDLTELLKLLRADRGDGTHLLRFSSTR